MTPHHSGSFMTFIGTQKRHVVNIFSWVMGVAFLWARHPSSLVSYPIMSKERFGLLGTAQLPDTCRSPEICWTLDIPHESCMGLANFATHSCCPCLQTGVYHYKSRCQCGLKRRAHSKLP